VGRSRSAVFALLCFALKGLWVKNVQCDKLAKVSFRNGDSYVGKASRHDASACAHFCMNLSDSLTPRSLPLQNRPPLCLPPWPAGRCRSLARPYVVYPIVLAADLRLARLYALRTAVSNAAHRRDREEPQARVGDIHVERWAGMDTACHKPESPEPPQPGAQLLLSAVL
jgi:hypothetical protein